MIERRRGEMVERRIEREEMMDDEDHLKDEEEEVTRVWQEEAVLQSFATWKTVLQA